MRHSIPTYAFRTIILITCMLTLGILPTFAQDSDPASVVGALVDAINAGDVDAAVSLFAEGAVNITLPPPPGSDGVNRGQNEIRANYTASIERNLQAGYSGIQVNGDSVSWTLSVVDDVFRSLGSYPIEFHAVAIVQDGQIQSMTLIMSRVSLAELEDVGNRGLAAQALLVPWNEDNLEAVDVFYAPDFVNHDPANPGVDGAAGVKQLIQEYRTAFPDLEFTIEDQMVEEDRVTIRWTATGTQEGEFRNIEPTDAQVSFSGITISRVSTDPRIENRQILENWTYWDVLSLMQQLGVEGSP